MNKGYLFLIFAAFSYASMGALVKALSIDMGPYLQTFLRLIVSAGLTAMLVVVTKKPFLLKNTSDYILMLFMGVIGYGLQIIFFTLAIYHNTIGNTLFLFSSYPLLAAIFGFLFLKEKLNKRLIVSLILLSCALFLFFDPTNLSGYFLGNTYALLGGATFALYIIWSRILSKRGNAPETITLWSVSIAVVTSGIAAGLFEEITFSLSSQAIFFLVLFGILNAVAFNLVNKGFQTVAAGTGTMILMLEPIIGTLMGLFLFQEIPTLLFILGAFIMISAIYIATFKSP